MSHSLLVRLMDRQLASWEMVVCGASRSKQRPYQVIAAMLLESGLGVSTPLTSKPASTHDPFSTGHRPCLSSMTCHPLVQRQRLRHHVRLAKAAPGQIEGRLTQGDCFGWMLQEPGYPIGKRGCIAGRYQVGVAQV